jgi:hypothetical protein
MIQNDEVIMTNEGKGKGAEGKRTGLLLSRNVLTDFTRSSEASNGLKLGLLSFYTGKGKLCLQLVSSFPLSVITYIFLCRSMVIVLVTLISFSVSHMPFYKIVVSS